MRYKYHITIAFVLSLLAGQTLDAQTFTDRELKAKTFKVLPETVVEINNKYGKVHVTPWRKDSVRFEVEIILNSNSVSRLSKLKSGIEIDFTSSKSYISAISDFGTNGNQLMNELRNLSEQLIPGKNTLEVNYRVYTPEYINLNIINKFGDIYIDDLRGEINISLSNGDMKINSLNGEARIELSFGSADINHLNDATLLVSYGDLDISRAEKLRIISKSSTLNLDEVDVLSLDTRRDKYFIGMVLNAKITSNFSQIWMEELTCELIAEMKFGDLTLDRINRDFCRIDILTEYADLNMFIARDSDYKADVYYHKDAMVNFPTSLPESGVKTINRNENELHSYFTAGFGENLPEINIKAPQKCYINLKEK